MRLLDRQWGRGKVHFETLGLKHEAGWQGSELQRQRAGDLDINIPLAKFEQCNDESILGRAYCLRKNQMEKAVSLYIYLNKSLMLGLPCTLYVTPAVIPGSNTSVMASLTFQDPNGQVPVPDPTFNTTSVGFKSAFIQNGFGQNISFEIILADNGVI